MGTLQPDEKYHHAPGTSGPKARILAGRAGFEITCVHAMAKTRGEGLERAQARRAEAGERQHRGPTLATLIRRRYGRRGFLGGALAAGLAFGAFSASPWRGGHAAARVAFQEIAHGADETHHVAPGHRADVLIRWGDPVVAGAPPFDPHNHTAEAQEQQFGYNNDYVGYVPLPLGSRRADHGLLCVNHEYTNEELIFPGLGEYDDQFSGLTKAIVEIEMACHGGSIIEVARRDKGTWRVVPDSAFARRITARGTAMEIAGPAAGSARLKTSRDPTGRRVMGTVANCGGGITPWGSYLMAEENFNNYFWSDVPADEDADLDPALRDHPEQTNYARYGVPGRKQAWAKYHERWHIEREPNEANRFGWIVEVDPLDPTAAPIKRTALGRFKHEGAESVVNPDGRVVIYSGDDEGFEYLYKFVTRDRHVPGERKRNMGLLDDGVLYVASFNADGTVDWRPLVFGHEALVPANGFHGQADVLIETRRAAEALGATPMDRPEGVQPNPMTGAVYVMLTANDEREAGQRDAVHDRAENQWGQILELTPPAGDHAAASFRWDILVKCGDPNAAAVGATWHPATSVNGWFARPDNAAVDGRGRLWVATDQGRKWSETSGSADGLWALETEGAARGTGRMFFRVPLGAELCGPVFTPDDETLFVAVQHPGSDGVEDYASFGRKAVFEDPATRWPDFDPGMPPRPSVVVITKQGGGAIGA